MNSFVAGLVQMLHESGIKAVLLKGQGIAQCYAKPLWRSSGDVDLLMDKENYRKAKKILLPMASESGKEFEYDRHQSLTISAYTVELHGSQRCGLSGRMDAVIVIVGIATSGNEADERMEGIWHICRRKVGNADRGNAAIQRKRKPKR